MAKQTDPAPSFWDGIESEYAPKSAWEVTIGTRTYKGRSLVSSQEIARVEKKRDKLMQTLSAGSVPAGWEAYANPDKTTVYAVVFLSETMTGVTIAAPGGEPADLPPLSQVELFRLSKEYGRVFQSLFASAFEAGMAPALMETAAEIDDEKND